MRYRWAIKSNTEILASGHGTATIIKEAIDRVKLQSLAASDVSEKIMDWATFEITITR